MITAEHTDSQMSEVNITDYKFFLLPNNSIQSVFIYVQT
jgi:hypothetical protein